MPDQRLAGAGGRGDRDRRPLAAGRARARRTIRRIPAILRRARRTARDGDRRGHASQGRDLPHYRRRRFGAPVVGSDPARSDAAGSPAAILSQPPHPPSLPPPPPPPPPL